MIKLSKHKKTLIHDESAFFIPKYFRKFSLLEAGGIEPPSESPLQSVLHT